MSYQNLYSMPCRLPCDRYRSTEDVFEAAAPSQPVVAVEGYADVYKKKMKVNNRNQCHCNPTVIVREDYDYDPRVFGENYEYEPTIGREGFDENMNCGCAMNNPPYRMENCGYNQSPSFITQHMFEKPIAPSVAQMLQSPAQVRQMAQGMAPRDLPVGNGNADCGCAMNNPPYRMDNCGYNQSPTWSDQAGFRQNVQNNY